jgi:hypothetical protein
MKKPTKSIVTSTLLAVAFGALSVGSTFALFTSQSQTEIDIQSGIVNVESKATLVNYSSSVDGTNHDFGAEETSYSNDKVGNLFKIQGSTVTIDKMVPGDSLTIKLTALNKSNVETKTRFMVAHSTDGTKKDLFPALKFSFSDGTLTPADIFTWQDNNAAQDSAGDNLYGDGLLVTITLPDNDNGQILFGSANQDNQYQDSACSIAFSLQAVQGNAAISPIDEINGYLTAELLFEGHNNTMHDAVVDMREIGYGLTNLNVLNGYVYDLANDQFVKENTVTANKLNYFKMFEAMPQEQTFSIYAVGNTWTTVNGLTVGFDAGDTNGISSITYDRHDATVGQEVAIRTNTTSTSLTINAPLDIVHHYGDVGALTIEAIANASYHEFGKAKFVEIKTGRMALEKTAEVEHIHLATSEVQEEAVFNNITISKAENVQMPDFSRDPVTIPDGGRLVVALQEGTEDITEETELDYVWLTAVGVYEQVTVSASDEVAGTNYAADSQNAEQKTTAQQIANNITFSEGEDNYKVVASKNATGEWEYSVQTEAGEATSAYTAQATNNVVEVTNVTTQDKVEVTVENGMSEQEKEEAKKEASLFAGGQGTAQDPYLIDSILGLKNIDKKCNSEDLTYFKLISDFIVSNEDLASYTDYWNASRSALIGKISNAVIDGNNHKITANISGATIFGDVRGSNLSSLDVTINGTNASLIFYSENIELSGITIDGQICWETGNNGAFIIYPRYNVTMLNCINEAELSTITGDTTMYCAVFFGYGFPNNSTIIMTNCSNKGSLTAGRASLVMANCSYGAEGPTRYIDFYLNQCSNDGQIISTSVNDDNNLLVSIISDKAYAYHFTIDGTTYTTSTTTKWTDPLPSSLLIGEGTFVKGSNDTLGITENADGTFTITPSNKSVAKYIVSVGVYTSTAIGSSRSYVTEEISANGDYLVSTLKNLKFIDNAWIEANPTAQIGTLAGNTIYTIGDESFYLVNEPNRCNVGGTPKIADMISVTAVDSQGRILSSASLKKI